MIARFSISTKSKVELQDITSRIRETVQSSGVKEGVCYLFVPHTTARVIINENADPDVARDILAQLERMVPVQGGYYHREGNAPAHIKSSLVGCSQALLVEDGRLVLGTWQGVFLCEFDGPRQRAVLVEVLSSGEEL